MKAIILYKTKLGSTEKYAKWLSENIKADISKMDEFDMSRFKNYDCVIVMSGTYAAQMPLTKFLKSNWEKIKDKKIFAIAVGAAPEDNWYSKISYKLIPKYIRQNIKYAKIAGRTESEPASKIKKENLDKVIKMISQ